MAKKPEEIKTVWVEVAPGRKRLVVVRPGGVEQRNGTFYFRGSDLSKKDALSLSRQLGVRIDNLNEAKAVMRERGLRFVEHGDVTQKTLKELRDWQMASPETRGPLPAHLADSYGQMPEGPRPDIHELYREARQQLRRR